MNVDSINPSVPGAATEPAVPEAGLSRFELTIWERAEHWRFFEVVQAVSEADARAQFRRCYGKGYRLQHVHSIG